MLLPSTFHTQPKAATTPAQFSCGRSHCAAVIPATVAGDQPQVVQQVPETGIKTHFLASSCLLLNLPTFSRREASRLLHIQSVAIKTSIHQLKRILVRTP